VKLLLDQNLSYKLATPLQEEYPGTVAAREIGLSTASDSVLWVFARAHGFAIVTKDSDFLQRTFLLGPPPKVIWVGLGNCSTRQVLDLLRKSSDKIREFETGVTGSLLALS
jgi:predicted nuclease of predicted toxin-antitoxin system